MQTITLTSESGVELAHSDLRAYTQAYLLLNGSSTGSIFGPYPLETARRYASDAAAATDPHQWLLSAESTTRSLRPARSLVVSRF